jgi:anti-anti-sigma factor
MREESAHFDATIDNCEKIGAFVQQCMRDAQLSHEQFYNLQLAIEEHIVNLIEHGFQKRPGEVVTVVCQHNHQHAQVKIIDASAGFDPRNFSIPDVGGIPVSELAPGGFGNYFICELMDEVEYVHRPYSGNTLILTLYTPQHVGQKSTQAKNELTVEESMEIRTRQDERYPQVSIVTLEGRIAVDTTAQVESALTALLDEGVVNLIVDMGAVSYISSAGLRVFLTALKRVKAQDGGLALVNLIPNVAKVFKLAGFTKIFTILDDVESALQLLGTS